MKKLFYLFILLLLPLIISAQQLTHKRAPFINNESRDSLMKVLLTNAEIWRQDYNNSNSLNQISPFFYKVPDKISSNSNEFTIYSANFQKNIYSGGNADSILIFSVNSTCDVAVLFSRHTLNTERHIVIDRNILKWKKINSEWLAIDPFEVLKD